MTHQDSNPAKSLLSEVEAEVDSVRRAIVYLAALRGQADVTVEEQNSSSCLDPSLKSMSLFGGFVIDTMSDVVRAYESTVEAARRVWDSEKDPAAQEWIAEQWRASSRQAVKVAGVVRELNEEPKETS